MIAETIGDIATCVTILSTAVLMLAREAGIHSTIRGAKVRVSRYPLFEARDRLIRLVLDGKMSKDDRAWRFAYEATNRFLDPRCEVNVVDLIRTSRASSKRSKGEREDQQYIVLAVNENPEYRQALENVADAFVDMAILQSHWHHRLWLKAMALVERTSVPLGDHVKTFVSAASSAASRRVRATT